MGEGLAYFDSLQRRKYVANKECFLPTRYSRFVKNQIVRKRIIVYEDVHLILIFPVRRNFRDRGCFHSGTAPNPVIHIMSSTNTLHFHPQYIYRLRCSDKQSLPVFAAETDIGGPGFVDGNVFDLFSP